VTEAIEYSKPGPRTPWFRFFLLAKSETGLPGSSVLLTKDRPEAAFLGALIRTDLRLW